MISESGAFASETKFRYRGYYYDSETGFYYLQSRYYDPSICRFISADQYELVLSLSKILGQINLYAYCNNNPVMFTDESGEGIIGVLIACFIISGVIFGGIAGGLDSTNTGWGLVGDILIGGVKGGLIAAAWALSFAGGAMVGFGLGSVGGALALAGGGIMGGGAVAGMATAIAGVGVIVLGKTLAQAISGFRFAKQSRESQKERSTDKPSWVNRDMVDPNLSSEQNVKNILNEVCGPGGWDKSSPEYSKILKWIRRSLKIK